MLFLTDSNRKLFIQSIRKQIDRPSKNGETSSVPTTPQQHLNPYKKVSTIESVIHEVDSYITYNFSVGDLQDPLQFWKGKTFIWPKLASLIPEYFCIMATSTSSERTWSSMGRIITKARARLKTKTAEDLMMLKHNSEFWWKNKFYSLNMTNIPMGIPVNFKLIPLNFQNTTHTRVSTPNYSLATESLQKTFQFVSIFQCCVSVDCFFHLFHHFDSNKCS